MPPYVRKTVPKVRLTLLYQPGLSRYDRSMEKNPNDLYTFTLCQADWSRVIQALRNEAYQLTQESDRACEKGAQEYGEVLWEECTYLNAIADSIDFILPENV